MNIGTLLERAAQRWPDRCAVVEDDRDVRYSFSDFVHGIFTYARRLLSVTGLQPGARVAILGDATLEYLYADYGTMSAGLVRVSMDPSLSDDELTSQLTDAGAQLLLYAPQCAEAASRQQVRLTGQGLIAYPLRHFTTEAPKAASADLLEMPWRCAPEDIASLSYTGGTTGRPKAVVHTHGTLSAALQNIVMARDEPAGGIMLNVRPLWPISAVAVLAHFLAGGTVVLGGHFNAEEFPALVEKHKATRTSLVPTQIVRVLREISRTGAKVKSLKCLDVGAAAL